MVLSRFSLCPLLLWISQPSGSLGGSAAGACGLTELNRGFYYGEISPTVYLEVDVVSENLLSFSMYLISRSVSEDGESVITRPVLAQVHHSPYSFDATTCSLSFEDDLSVDARVWMLNDNVVESFSKLTSFYQLVTSFLHEDIRNQLPSELTGTVDEQGHIGLMSMIWVEPTMEAIDWETRINQVNAENDITVPNSPVTLPVVFRSIDGPSRHSETSRAVIFSNLSAAMMMILFASF